VGRGGGDPPSFSLSPKWHDDCQLKSLDGNIRQEARRRSRRKSCSPVDMPAEAASDQRERASALPVGSPSGHSSPTAITPILLGFHSSTSSAQQCMPARPSGTLSTRPYLAVALAPCLQPRSANLLPGRRRLAFPSRRMSASTSSRSIVPANFQPFNLAMIQLGQIGEDKRANLAHARGMVRRAAAGDGKRGPAQVVMLPVRRGACCACPPSLCTDARDLHDRRSSTRRR